jgi:hypothetical protein
VGEDVLPQAWDGSQEIVGLDQVTIVWGRETLYDAVAPASASIRLLDPTGFWATANDLNGRLVKIGRSTPARIVFRGQVTEIKSQLTVVRNPATGRNQFVWIVTLTVVDKLANLAQSRPAYPATLAAPGPTYAGGFFDATVVKPGTYIVGGVATPSIPSRYEQLLAAGILSYVASVANPDPAAFYGTASIAYVGDVFMEDGPSFLSLLVDLYALLPLGHVNYVPDTDSVIIGLPATSSGLSLTYAAGVLVLAPVAGLTIDAAQVGIPTEGATIESRIQASADIVRSHYRHYNGSSGGSPQSPVDQQIDILTTRGATSSTARVMDAGGIWTGNDNNPSTGPFYTPYALDFAQRLGAATKVLVDQINGQFASPDLSFDFRRFAPGDTIADVLLACYDQPTPLYFKNSILNYLPNYGPQFQLIGGTITWMGEKDGSDLPAGWSVDMTLAPAPSTAATATITTLVTNATATISSFDPNITLADLGDVTIGAA